MVRCGNENLPELTKDAFKVQTNKTGLGSIQMTYNEQTKKKQGDEMAYNKHDGDRSMIYEQPEDPDRCPVHTYEQNTSKLTNKSNDFFQTPNHNVTNPKYDKWYKKTPVGVGTIGSFMATISANACLSKRYTNHKIRGTTATAMKWGRPHFRRNCFRN